MERQMNRCIDRQTDIPMNRTHSSIAEQGILSASDQSGWMIFSDYTHKTMGPLLLPPILLYYHMGVYCTTSVSNIMSLFSCNTSTSMDLLKGGQK